MWLPDRFLFFVVFQFKLYISFCYVRLSLVSTKLSHWLGKTSVKSFVFVLNRRKTLTFKTLELIE